MPVNINLGGLKISTIDKAFVNIGPSLQHILRSRQHQNQGYGELNGDRNQVEAWNVVEDDDFVDVTLQKQIIINGRRVE